MTPEIRYQKDVPVVKVLPPKFDKIAVTILPCDFEPDATACPAVSTCGPGATSIYEIKFILPPEEGFTRVLEQMQALLTQTGAGPRSFKVVAVVPTRDDVEKTAAALEGR